MSCSNFALEAAISQLIKSMKFKEIPEAIRKARLALYELWRKATSAEDRDRIIKSAPKSSIVQRVVARLRSDDMERVHAEAIMTRK